MPDGLGDNLLFCLIYVFILRILFYFLSCTFLDSTHQRKIYFFLLLCHFQSQNLTGNVLYTSPSKIKTIYLSNTQFIYHSIFCHLYPSSSITKHPFDCPSVLIHLFFNILRFLCHFFLFCFFIIFHCLK